MAEISRRYRVSHGGVVWKVVMKGEEECGGIGESVERLLEEGVDCGDLE